MSSSNFGNYKPGIGSVGQYQMSGIPFTTSSVHVDGDLKGTTSQGPTEIEFPRITKFVTVINDGSGSNRPLRVGFSSLGVSGSDAAAQNNYFILNNGESFTGEWRVGSVYLYNHDRALYATASVIAGLTGIQTSNMDTIPTWSGSNGV